MHGYVNVLHSKYQCLSWKSLTCHDIKILLAVEAISMSTSMPECPLKKENKNSSIIKVWSRRINELWRRNACIQIYLLQTGYDWIVSSVHSLKSCWWLLSFAAQKLSQTWRMTTALCGLLSYLSSSMATTCWSFTACCWAMWCSGAENPSIDMLSASFCTHPSPCLIPALPLTTVKTTQVCSTSVGHWATNAYFWMYPFIVMPH